MFRTPRLSPTSCIFGCGNRGRQQCVEQTAAQPKRATAQAAAGRRIAKRASGVGAVRGARPRPSEYLTACHTALNHAKKSRHYSAHPAKMLMSQAPAGHQPSAWPIAPAARELHNSGRVGCSSFTFLQRGQTMLRWALVFLIIALISGALGMFRVEWMASEI